MARPNNMIMKSDEARAMDVREEIQEECERIESGYISLAQKLNETVENGYFIKWGFSSFEEYCKDELKIGYRRAGYLVQIAQTVEALKIPWEDIEGIGWTKVRAILPALKQDGEVGDWLNLATDLSVRDLEKLVKDNKIGAEISSSGGEAMVSLKFRVTKEQFSIISDALDTAKAVIDLDNDVAALEQMCYDYFMSSDGDTDQVTLETLVNYAENKFGVTIEVTGRADIEDIIEGSEEPEIEV
jgi:hypothetical protein